jgi:DNA polymerase (family 10)
MEKIMRAALERGCFLELNAQPDRLDLNDHHCRMAKEMGLKLAICTDAHHVGGLKNMRYGIYQARRGWLSSDDIINTRKVADLQKLLKR